MVLAPSPASAFAGFAVAGIGLAYASPVVMELSGAAGRRADGGGGEREVAVAALVLLIGPLTLAAGVVRYREPASAGEPPATLVPCPAGQGTK
ncbi:hypothetical protein PV682_04125 [Streptomyces niveiscabiei]|uniref:hypothetical protein n=1 Tax=Streptomyces niveiscabiei TaxID=164115 RepID=UPI0029B47DE8|nr:hypothetical protein [Streptomyces niveiscabiei]MDX3380636.1 hypothetical protein [Streptomyces niveiscabiei]